MNNKSIISNSIPNSSDSPYLIVGRGKVARSFGKFFEDQKIPFIQWNRDSQQSLEALVPKAKSVLLLISDSAIDSFLKQHPYLTQKKIMHASGLRIFQGTLDFHPLMTFTDLELNPQRFSQTTFVGTASENAFRDFFKEWTPPYIQITQDQKTLYHGLCVMMLSFPVILWQRLFTEFATLKVQNSSLAPYLSQMLENFLKESLTALSGPFLRNDQEAMALHLKSLPSDLVSLYQELKNFYFKQNQSSPWKVCRVRIEDFEKMKKSGKKISMLTCYDFAMARILNKSEISMLLVGDSVAQVVHGFDSTIPATVGMMALHTSAVSRGAPDKFIVADMPFGSFRKGPYRAVEAAEKLLKAGAHAVKLEGVYGHENVIVHLIGSGIPVMGHLGLTPQFVNTLSGYKVQGRTKEGAEQLNEQAKKLQDLGAFALVLECVPSAIASEITRELQIPVIGIGAGAGVDGQVLVLNDLLGFNDEKKFKFVRHFLKAEALIHKATEEYVEAVESGNFPSQKESFE